MKCYSCDYSFPIFDSLKSRNYRCPECGTLNRVPAYVNAMIAGSFVLPATIFMGNFLVSLTLGAGLAYLVLRFSKSDVVSSDG